MKKKQPQCGGGCLGTPLRALSRACDSACDLYVRGMSGCARHVPSGAAGAVGRGAYGRSASAESMLLRASSDRGQDLVRAAARQSRRVAPAEVADATGTRKSAAPGGNKSVPEWRTGAAAMGPSGKSRRIAPAEVADATGTRKSAAPVGDKVVPERRTGAAAMETIAEDAPCEFGPVDGACVLPPPSRRRAAVTGGVAARPGGFGAIKTGSEVLAR